ncbi:MAG: molybdopterin molybdotransferase MoeA [Elusimicrobia bacterium]|nr:molybdopterin molybdotransferase MoeA [Elusimicrobiota bacterium]
MISADKALQLIFDLAPVLGAETIPLTRSVDRVLASDIRARTALPPFDNSAMDGFALRAADLEDAAPQNPVELTVLETVRAGETARLEVKSGQAARIMTGAPLPRGADSVVMVEATEPGADGKVRLAGTTRARSHVRERGEDVAEGSVMLEKGALLRPYDVALLAAQGIAEVPVIRLPRVAVLATGDELVDHREEPAEGRIRNSNGPALLAALARWGVAAYDLGIAPDEPDALRAVLAPALERSDVLLATGGVSVGDFDCTKSVFAELGVREVFWKVAIKPGKPLFFGVLESAGAPAKLAFGLPGNPIAALVCLEEFVRPALEKLQGYAPKHPSYHLAGVALDDYPAPPDRRQYLFCRARPASGGYELDILRPQGSAMMGMASRANAVAVAPDGRVRRGDVLGFRWLK